VEGALLALLWTKVAVSQLHYAQVARQSVEHASWEVLKLGTVKKLLAWFTRQLR
jgi:hypothetical protein